MSISKSEQIGQRLRAIETTEPWGFLASFLDAFEFPRATFERLRIRSSTEGYEYASITNKILYAVDASNDISETLSLSKSQLINGKPYRFYVATNGSQIAAFDSRKEIYLKCFTRELESHCAFFLPLMGIESRDGAVEKTLDETISIDFARLVNQIKLNRSNNRREYDNFILRILLLCLLSGFDSGELRNLGSILKTYYRPDGIETILFLKAASRAIGEEDRNSLPEFIKGIPYFASLDSLDDDEWPALDLNCHEIIVALFEQNWSRVTPDVIGSVVQTSLRHSDTDMPFNYTSAMYVSYLSSPLFLRGWRETFSQNKNDIVVLMELLAKVQSTTLFDPSCGVSSVLSMAYADMKQFEIELVKAIRDIDSSCTIECSVSLENTLGLEYDPLKVKASSLTLALVDVGFDENRKYESFTESFKMACDSLKQGDPILSDWNEVCPNNGKVMLLANPEYRGSRKMDNRQKQGHNLVFAGMENTKDLDYSACWIMKGAQYIAGTESQAAFFATNSVTQGDQVSKLWPLVFDLGVEIAFAHQSFKWRTAAQNTNAVTVVAVGLASCGVCSKKFIDDGEKAIVVAVIGPYLTPNECIVIGRTSPIAPDFSKMPKGNMPYDHGLLMFDAAQKDTFVSQNPGSEQYLKRVMGGDELINDIERWCIWTPTKELADEASKIDGIRDIYKSVKDWRATTTASRALKESPYRFREILATTSYSLVIPNLSSENYSYIPMGFIDSGIIATNLLFALYDCDIVMFGILCSRIHNLWARAVGGGYETRIRYSNKLVYNTFPMPRLTEQQKDRIRQCALNVLAEREVYYERSLGDLYGNLPDSLAMAHRTLDLVVEECFQERPFASDVERLEVLFSLYEEAIDE